MKNVLSVDRAVDLIRGGYANEADRLETIVNNFKVVENAEKPLVNDMKKCFADAVKTFKDDGIVFKGVVFDENELEDSLRETDKQIKDLNNQRDQIRNNYSNYNSMDFERGLNSFERKEKLDEYSAKWEELNQKIDDSWREYRRLEEEIKTSKNNNEKKDYDSFVYLSKMFLNNKQEMLANVNKIKNESLRIKTKGEILMIEDFISSINEKEAIKEAGYKEIDEIAKKVNLDEIVYEEGKDFKFTKNVEQPEKQENNEFPAPNADMPTVDEQGFEFNPNQVEENKPIEINNLADLVSEILRLNPDKKIDVISKDGITSLSIPFPPKFLKLPEANDFYYTEGLGINNKKDDRNPYMALPVEVSLNQQLLNNAVLNEGPRAKQIPSGKQHVKSNPTAVIDKYAKVLFVGAGIGAVALSLTAFIAVPGVLTAAGTLGFLGGGAGLSAGIQAIYQKIVGDSPEKIEELEDLGIQNPEDEVWSVSMVAKLEKGINKLIKSFPRRRKEKLTRESMEAELNNTEESEENLFEGSERSIR